MHLFINKCKTIRRRTRCFVSRILVYRFACLTDDFKLIELEKSFFFNRLLLLRKNNGSKLKKKYEIKYVEKSTYGA